MSRSKRNILETEAMLCRLERLLTEHAAHDPDSGTIIADAESLRRISITLHRWHELECNGEVECDEDTGKAYGVPLYGLRHGGAKRFQVPNREAGARKRLARILKNYPALTAYVQTDPRGCALYILKPGDVPEGADVSSCYSRGLAVFQ